MWRVRGAALLLGVFLLGLTARVSSGRPIPDAFDVPSYVKNLTSGYLSNEEMASYLEDYVKRCSNISRLVRFGTSVGGLPLLALEISSKPGVEVPGPAFKYVANIHGNEPSGRQLLLLLAEKLCAEGGQPGTPAHQLVTRISLWLIPSLNPDGFATRRRENKNGVDLNRDFPDPILNLDQNSGLSQPLGTEQPETLAMMNFTLSHRIIASLAMHEGALVANFPYDGYPDGSRLKRGTPNLAPDDDVLRALSTSYATLHTTMAASKMFPGGITNGAQWYPLYGGMQDWNYVAANCLEITLELNDDMYPGPARLAAMWEENEMALLEWPLKAAYSGLHGKVVARAANGRFEPLEATIQVKDHYQLITSSAKHGTYYRPLAPGNYTVTVRADGHRPVEATLTVPDGGLKHTFELEPLNSSPQTQETVGAGSGGEPTPSPPEGGGDGGKGSEPALPLPDTSVRSAPAEPERPPPTTVPAPSKGDAPANGSDSSKAVERGEQGGEEQVVGGQGARGEVRAAVLPPVAAETYSGKWLLVLGGGSALVVTLAVVMWRKHTRPQERAWQAVQTSPRKALHNPYSIRQRHVDAA